MILLKTIRDTDIGADFPAPPEYRERQAARAVLFEKEGRVAIINVTNKNYHKLPGGGIDPGENAEKALKREVLEETAAPS
jgi:8-oxo-dGTP diphosphatase